MKARLHFLVRLSAIIAPILAHAQESGNPYWPANNKTWIQYQIYGIHVDSHNSDSGIIVASGWTPVTTVTVSINDTTNPWSGEAGLSARTQKLDIAGKPNPTGTVPPDLCNTIVHSVATAFGATYIGEFCSISNETCPPEAELPFNPYPGQVIDGFSTIVHGQITYPGFHWRLLVIGHMDNWEGWSDCWYTTLREYQFQPLPLAYYNFVFARNVGLVGMWATSGQEWIAIAHGSIQ